MIQQGRVQHANLGVLTSNRPEIWYLEALSLAKWAAAAKMSPWDETLVRASQPFRRERFNDVSERIAEAGTLIAVLLRGMVSAETFKRWTGVALIVAAVLATALAWSGLSLSAVLAALRAQF